MNTGQQDSDGAATRSRLLGESAVNQRAAVVARLPALLRIAARLLVVPIVVSAIVIPQLGFTFQAATFGVAAYRLAHYDFPVIAGGATYLTLRPGPWQLAHTGRSAETNHATGPGTGGGDHAGAPLERRTGIEPRGPIVNLSPRCTHGT